MAEPEFPVPTVILVGVVTDEVAIGLFVLQVIVVVQVLLPAVMEQSVASRLPDMAANVADTVQAAVIGPVV